MLELICTRESGAVFDAGGLNCVLTFIREHGSQVHRDTLHSAMTVVSRLCGKMEPQDPSLEKCVESLSTLLQHDDQFVSFLFFCLQFSTKLLDLLIYHMYVYPTQKEEILLDVV